MYTVNNGYFYWLMLIRSSQFNAFTIQWWKDRSWRELICYFHLLFHHCHRLLLSRTAHLRTIKHILTMAITCATYKFLKHSFESWIDLILLYSILFPFSAIEISISHQFSLLSLVEYFLNILLESCISYIIQYQCWLEEWFW